MLLANYAVILARLRDLLLLHQIHAYIVPSGDAHYTEFIADCHQRRAYISGFTGSAGTAIVTNATALLWTDGRYFLQAEQQLDKKLWTLMKDGQPNVPSQVKWLKDNLPVGGKVGVDPTLYTKRQWDSLQQELNSVGKSLVAVKENLVDKIWDDRPSCENAKPIINHGLEFAGISTKTKVENVRKEMKDSGAMALLVTELDEVAWLLNLRGSDIPYSSTFFSYVLLTETGMDFFVNQTQAAGVTSVLRENVPEIKIHNYADVFDVLNETVAKTSGKIWFNQNTNYALESLIPADRQMVKLTPIALMKAIKNPTEVTGYKAALIRDSAALCEFFAWLQKEIAYERNVTEISAAEKLHSFRRQRENFVDDSFETISAAGENSAIIHYMPTPETDRKINSWDMYLLDSGGLYRDGTTDITRTIHLGSPFQYQKNSYTRVLKGQIALTRAVFPQRITGQRLDSFARQFLWEVGMDYNHGTGHGVGSFLNVHEGPFSIGGGYNSQDPGMHENFFTSNEPGYYEDNVVTFGIRLENIVRVKNASLENNFLNRGFLGFEDVTFVPYDHKLIEFSMLTDDELKYLNDYQESIRKHVGTYMKQHNMSEEAYNWMIRATVPIPTDDPVTTTTPNTPSTPSTQASTPPTTTEVISPTTGGGNGVRMEMLLIFVPILTFLFEL